jgi:hypothetical protein
MSRTPEYTALKNYIHNTCGISKDDMGAIVKGVIRDIVEERMKDHMQTNAFGVLVRKQITQFMGSSLAYAVIKGVVHDMVSITVTERRGKDEAAREG